jgi:hypothetical protein
MTRVLSKILKGNAFAKISSDELRILKGGTHQMEEEEMSPVIFTTSLSRRSTPKVIFFSVQALLGGLNYRLERSCDYFLAQ